MRWMFFLLIGCGKPGGGMVGSQGLDTATPQSGLGLVAIGGGTFTLGETDPDSYLEHLKPGEIRQVILATGQRTIWGKRADSEQNAREHLLVKGSAGATAPWGRHLCSAPPAEERVRCC